MIFVVEFASSQAHEPRRISERQASFESIGILRQRLDSSLAGSFRGSRGIQGVCVSLKGLGCSDGDKDDEGATLVLYYCLSNGSHALLRPP